jgi:enoyl-CoA hydratase/carnithine racemase
MTERRHDPAGNDGGMELKATRYALDGPVATVWLHRPHRHNAWTGRMHTELRWILSELDADPAVRVVIITGTAPAFSVGGDSDALAGHVERGSYDTGVPTDARTPGHGVDPRLDAELTALWGLRFPVIAAVNGACAGVALALACFCDLRFAAAEAKLTTAAPKLGLPAEYGLSWILPRLVGPTHAADLLLSARVVRAADAPPGLFNAVLPTPVALSAHVAEYAHALATTVGPAAVAATKRQVVTDLLRHDPAASVRESLERMNAAMRTAEYAEGVAALRERRPPRFG